MDSQIVTKGLNRIIRPVLKDAGFTAFTSRTAWRYTSNKVDVVNFQSFNPYLADGVGCTTFSFAVNLGVYFQFVPSYLGDERPKRKEGYLRPAEYECHLRRPLKKAILQPVFPRQNIWYVDAEGLNLDHVAEDAREVIVRDGFPWFDRLDEREFARMLLDDHDPLDGTWGIGGNSSPVRHYLTGYTALHLEDYSLALHHLQAALGSGCFRRAEGRLKQDIGRATVESTSTVPISGPLRRD
jgi:hypothetical protein